MDRGIVRRLSGPESAILDHLAGVVVGDEHAPADPDDAQLLILDQLVDVPWADAAEPVARGSRDGFQRRDRSHGVLTTLFKSVREPAQKPPGPTTHGGALGMLVGHQSLPNPRGKSMASASSIVFFASSRLRSHTASSFSASA